MHDPSGRESLWGGWIRTIAWRIQSPLPYRLATPHRVQTNLQKKAKPSFRSRASDFFEKAMDGEASSLRCFEKAAEQERSWMIATSVSRPKDGERITNGARECPRAPLEAGFENAGSIASA
jgi:hypothetical protein